MIIESISRLKKTLQTKDYNEVIDIAIRLAKYKVENKELLHYLLNEQHDEHGFIEMVRAELDESFEVINASNLYYTKKGLRKALKYVNKQIKYSGIKETEVQLLIHFCKNMKDMSINWTGSKVICNLYDRQLIRIEKAMSKLHEDLQYDLRLEMEGL